MSVSSTVDGVTTRFVQDVARAHPAMLSDGQAYCGYGHGLAARVGAEVAVLANRRQQGSAAGARGRIAPAAR